MEKSSRPCQRSHWRRKFPLPIILIIYLIFHLPPSSAKVEKPTNFSVDLTSTPAKQSSPRNVTAQIGHSILLHCIIEFLGDKTVSWMRLRDFHLLTVGFFTYIPDKRFIVRYGTVQLHDWALQIRDIQLTDEGIYECQVNTDPPRSQYYRLNIVIPETRMIGSPDMFVRAGSPLNLTCLISNSPELPSVVFWYHNDRVVNYDFESNGRGLITLSKNPNAADSLISRLLIRSTKLTDSGNYSCHFVGSGSEPVHIRVHVLEGKKKQSNLISENGNVSRHLPIQNDESRHAIKLGNKAFSGVNSPMEWKVGIPLIILLNLKFILL